MFYLYDIQTIKETVSDYFDLFQGLDYMQAIDFLLSIGYDKSTVLLLSEADYYKIKSRLTM